MNYCRYKDEGWDPIRKVHLVFTPGLRLYVGLSKNDLNKSSGTD